MTVSYKQYTEEKARFLRSIGDWKCDTSAMDHYGIYHKTYFSTEKDAQWYEVMTPVYEEVEAQVEVHGIPVTIKQTVKLLKTEFWSSKDPASKYYYEKF